MGKQIHDRFDARQALPKSIAPGPPTVRLASPAKRHRVHAEMAAEKNRSRRMNLIRYHHNPVEVIHFASPPGRFPRAKPLEIQGQNIFRNTVRDQFSLHALHFVESPVVPVSGNDEMFDLAQFQNQDRRIHTIYKMDVRCPVPAQGIRSQKQSILSRRQLLNIPIQARFCGDENKAIDSNHARQQPHCGPKHPLSQFSNSEPPRIFIKRHINFAAACVANKRLSIHGTNSATSNLDNLAHKSLNHLIMSILAGKIGLVFGVANKRSIAWAIAQAWHKAGATLIFTYQGERLKDNVAELAATFGADTLILPCDVTKDDEIARVFAEVGGKFGKLNLLLHSVAFAPREALEGTFVDTSREAFRVAHDVSAYSLVALARSAAPLMTEGGSIVAMSYYGSEKVVPHYNVMGVAKAALEASTRYLAYDLGPKKIRVNCISAGPVNTLAARGIAGFTDMLKHYEAHAPLKRNVLPDELGATGTFLASDGAAAITGQVLYVDCGYQIMGM